MSDQIDDLFDKQEEESNAEQWDFNTDPTIKGILVGVGVAPGREYGPYFVLRIKEQESGSVFGIPLWGTVMNSQILDVVPKVGAPIGIKFKGMKANQDGSREYKDWAIVSPEPDFEAWHNLKLRLAGSKTAPVVTPGTAEDVEDYF